ncbi:MAG TPA: SGNH/GDSL hydrolase family protein [Abditibacteriaceae bacterium]|jgi:lysophospholipase L1-like esterase
MSLPHIFVVGDSISMAYGPYLQRYTAGRFAYARKGDKIGDIELPHAEHDANGGDSRTVLSYLRALHEAGFRTDYLLLNCGLHDIKREPGTNALQVPPEEYLDNLKAIFPLVIEMALQPVWVRTIPVDEALHTAEEKGFLRFLADVEEYNRIADETMYAANIPVLDLYSFTQNLGENLSPGGVHFSDEVAAQQAAFLAGALAALEARKAVERYEEKDES